MAEAATLVTLVVIFIINQSLSLCLSLFLSFAVEDVRCVEARCEGVRQRARCVLSPLSERSPI